MRLERRRARAFTFPSTDLKTVEIGGLLGAVIAFVIILLLCIALRAPNFAA